MNRTSQLDAVNLLLSSINQSPVNSLLQTTVDVSRALYLINSNSREVQASGWKFNTEYEADLTPNSTGEIVLADNVTSVDLDPMVYSKREYDVVLRGSRLLNRVGNTFQFTQTLKGTLILCLDWDDLPEHARKYIALKSRRQFQADSLGDDNVSQSQAADELQALARLRRLETNSKHDNFLDWHGKAYGWMGARL